MKIESLVRRSFLVIAFAATASMASAAFAGACSGCNCSSMKAKSPESSGGADAPEFTLTDTNGVAHSLASFRGKVVVLEWTNYQCPFVKKFYGDGHMQAMQARYADQGVVWLSIASSAPGKQGHHSPAKWNEQIERKGVKAAAVLLDESGEVGKAYGARTTPHMFVITKEGKIAYQGAIDSKRSTDPADIDGATNYVAAALDAVLAGKAVEVEKTQPYGCGVKYASK